MLFYGTFPEFNKKITPKKVGNPLTHEIGFIIEEKNDQFLPN